VGWGPPLALPSCRRFRREVETSAQGRRPPASCEKKGWRKERRTEICEEGEGDERERRFFADYEELDAWRSVGIGSFGDGELFSGTALGARGAVRAPCRAVLSFFLHFYIGIVLGYGRR
jgi:hypothetical protein